MAIDSTGKKFTMADSNTETFSDLLKQLGGLLGVGARSNGRYYLSDMCRASSINKWAKYKPVRLGKKANITDNDRQSVDYGMVVSGKYWVYNRLNGTTPNRIRDFDGYNHNAQCPLQSTSRFNKTLDLDTDDAYLMQEIPIYPSGIVATGSDVDLSLSGLTAYPYNNYIGLVFENRNTKARWYHSFDFTLKECVEQSWGIDQSYYPPLANMPNTNNGDVVDVWYCLVTTPNVEYGSVTSGMIYFAMDETHGHFTLNVQRFTLSTLSKFTPQSASSSTITYSYSGSSATISRIVYRGRLNYQTSNSHLAIDTEYQFLVNGSTLGTKVNKTIYLSDVHANEVTITKSQSVTISSSSLVINDYMVEVECRANLAGNDDYKVVMHYKLNVKTGAITNI